MSLQTNISFYNSRTAMYAVYSLLTLAVFVVVSPYFVYQAIRYKKYIGSLRQRLGFLPISFNIDGEDSIWIHAVSVGEALTARALAADLKARYPRLRLFVSTTTIAGQQVARRSLSNAEAVFYFPFDWTFIVRRILKLVRPRLFIMMETEIWPNLLRECRRRGVKTVMINGRISSRSYPRYRLIRPFFRRVLADVDRFCMQSDESARRLVDLGADPARVTVTGSLKFDSLELPAGVAHGKPRERVMRFFRLSPQPHGDRRRQHDARRRGRGAARVCSHQDRDAGRAGDSGAASPRTVRRGRAARARRGLHHHPPLRAADRRRAARRRGGARLDRRAGADLSGRDGGVRRRQPGRSRRPQHSRAGRVRQADRLRAAHAQLPGDRRRLCEQRRGRAGARPIASSKARCWSSSPTPCAAPASAPRRARWSKPTAARRPKRSRSSPS